MMEFFGIFEGKDDYISSKTPFQGKLPIDMTYDWNQYMYMLDTHPHELLDTNTSKMRIGLNSFHARPSAPDFAKTIQAELQDVLRYTRTRYQTLLLVALGLHQTVTLGTKIEWMCSWFKLSLRCN